MDIMFGGWENGGNDCWDWPSSKSLLRLPQHGSWGEVGGSGGGGGERRSWRRSIEARTSCGKKNENSHMEILTT